jgi:DNA-binding LacI/PurR family transcriptional regulator
VIDRLHAAGHRHFGVITGSNENSVSRERERGAVKRLRQLGLPCEVFEGAYDYASGDTGLRRLMLRTKNALDAVICASDIMAIGAIDCARHELGLKVPEQLSIVGFDGVGPASWASYAITTIRQPVERMAEAAVGMLLEQIERTGPTAEQLLFAGELIEGRSARLST